MFQRLKIVVYVLINIFLFKKEKVKTGRNLRVRGPIKLSIDNSAKLIIGDDFTLVSGLMLNPLGRNLKSFIRIDKKASISIGNNVGMSCVTLWAKKGIVIGDNVKLGADVFVLDSDMHSLDYQQRRGVESDYTNAVSKEIVIGNDVFIGTRSIICKGVNIGNRSIVGAGSVVVCNIPENEIWGGNPAKFIKKIN